MRHSHGLCSPRFGRLQPTATLFATLCVFVSAATSYGAVHTWKGGDGNWSDGAQWTNGVPIPGAQVVINAGSVLLTNETGQLSSLIVNGGSLAFSNWTTKVSATNVWLYGGEVTINNNFSDDPGLSNRVWIVCKNFFLGSSGTIAADGLGFTADALSTSVASSGPGGSKYRGGGSHGARGGYVGRGFIENVGPTNGVASAPILPGSAGGNSGGGHGGGAVRIEVAGQCVVNGVISANGANGTGTTYCGSGAGGSICITSGMFYGTNGTLRANGGSGSGGNKCGGSGGRIAVTYNTGDQDSAPIPTVDFSVAGGSGSSAGIHDGYVGTLYFSDAKFLEGDINRFTGQFLADGFTEWAVDSLTISNTWIRFPEQGFELTVTNDLTITGGGSRLGLGGDEHTSDGLFPFTSGTLSPSLCVGGDVIVTNGGQLHVYSGVSNALGYGATVTVTGELAIAAGSSVHPYSHSTDGGSVLFGAANVLIDGIVDADTTGYRWRYGSQGYRGGSAVLGSAGYYRGGGGHGGNGGYVASSVEYEKGLSSGSSNAPVLYPGGGGGSSGGKGGGLVRIDSVGTITLNGTITCLGGPVGTTYAGAGAGGGIYLRCGTFAGSGGVLDAGGGDSGAGGNRGGGGGGRIVVWRAYDTYTGSVSTNVEGGLGNDGTVGSIKQGQAGTVIYGDLGPTLTNLYATNVTGDAADLVGQVVSTGDTPTVVRCFWGEGNGGDMRDAWDTNDTLGVTGLDVVTNALTGLSPATQYYFRFHGTNRYGERWASPSVVFSTVGGATVDNGGGATSVTATTATLRGDVTSGNPTPEAFFCWGDNDPGVSDTGSWDTVVSKGLLVGPYSHDVGGLLANKTYYYRCYVTNADGPAWAPTVSNFTTLSPEVSIGDVVITEGHAGTTDAVFTVSLAATSDVAVAVDYGTSNGTAFASGDYTAANGTLTLGAGLVSTTITVRVKGDTTDEYPSEWFAVNLSNALGGSVADDLGVCTITDDDDVADIKTWSGTGIWKSDTNWSPYGRPSASDAVVISSGSLLLPSSERVASVTVTNTGALTFTNWSTKLTAENVWLRGGEVTSAGPITNNAPMSNRVWIACTNIFVGSGGLMSVDGKGYGSDDPTGAGPGGGYQHGGGSYGGRGGYPGRAYISRAGNTNGTAAAPFAVGSAGGGGGGGHGGGAIRLQVSGTCTVNGTITASGANSSGNYKGGGSGGGVMITCRTFHGTNGVVRAKGGDGTGSSNCGGGGGRIALTYNTDEQSAVAVPSVTLSAAGGDGISPGERDGCIGTLYFSDGRFLTTTIDRLSGQIMAPGLTNWSPDSLTVSNVWVRFPADGFNLTVTDDLVVTGSDGRLGLGGNRHDADRVFPFSELAVGPTLSVGGDLRLADGGILHVYSGLANAAGTNWGALIRVAGDVSVASGTELYTHSHPTNGHSVLIRASTVTVDGTIDGAEKGFLWTRGPGAGTYRSGGGYGGEGGYITYANRGLVYGSSNAPVQPGSGGGGTGGRGGSLVRIEAARKITLNGTISVAGGGVPGGYTGGGAGGGISLMCGTFQGAGGLLDASGGDALAGLNSGGGGGGRIAVWRRSDNYSGACSTDVVGGLGNDGEGGAKQGLSGTVVWGYIPATGSLVLIR